MKFDFCKSAQNLPTFGSRGFRMAQTDRQTDSLKNKKKVQQKKGKKCLKLKKNDKKDKVI